MAIKPLAELQQDRAHFIRSAEDIQAKATKEDRLPTDDEIREIDEHISNAAKIATQIEQRQAADIRVERLSRLSEDLKKSNKAITTPSQPANEPYEAKLTVPATARRYSGLVAFKGPNADYNAYCSGQWIRAAIFNDASARSWCGANGIDFRNTLQEGTNTTGGYLVPDQFAQTIIDLRETYGVFRANCDVFPMGSDTAKIPRRSGGATAYWGSESGTMTASTPTWNQVQLVAKKLYCLVKMSSEVAEDAIINLADYLAREFAYQLAYQEDLAGFLGDGTSTYGNITGVFTAIIDGTHTAGAVDATSGHDLFTEVDLTDLTGLMGKLPQYAIGNAKWYCSQYAAQVVFGRLAASAGGNTIQMMGGGFAPSFLGYPIVVSQVLTASTSAINNTYMLGFGDLRAAATLGDRRGIQVAQTMDYYFNTDEIGLRATERVDINVHDLGDTTNAGPFVALIGNT